MPLESMPMSRSFRAFLLLAVLLWQSLAMLGPVTVAQRAGELEHMVVHNQDANHHHHADQALHMEDDDGAVQHLHADSGATTTGLLTSSPHSFIGTLSKSPPETSHPIWRSHTLDGPLRPPMPIA